MSKISIIPNCAQNFYEILLNPCVLFLWPREAAENLGGPINVLSRKDPWHNNQPD
jgi:hypothetical protein